MSFIIKKSVELTDAQISVVLRLIDYRKNSLTTSQQIQVEVLDELKIIFLNKLMGTKTINKGEEQYEKFSSTVQKEPSGENRNLDDIRGYYARPTDNKS